MNDLMEPKLAPPGAGLPGPELFIGRLLFRAKGWTLNRAGVNSLFAAERRKIRTLVDGCSPEQAARRVLIPRLRGLEDSSRYWSVLMTLEHLRIIHKSMTGVIMMLSKGKVPPGVASTAAVKPSAEVTTSVIPAYEESCDRLVETVAGIPDLRSKVRYKHPWFGLLNAANWHRLSATHLAIHRKQIEAICASLAG